MAESTSSPIPRSPRKSLEYTSCIDTTPPSSTCGNINAHSSFDFISQPRDCDSLGTKINDNNNHTQQNRILDRDLCRLDLNSNTYSLELNNKKLARAESISLPTTPIEQISSSFNHQCHPLLLFQTNNNDEKHIRLTSSTDNIIATTEELTNESMMSNSKR